MTKRLIVLAAVALSQSIFAAGAYKWLWGTCTGITPQGVPGEVQWSGSVSEYHDKNNTVIAHKFSAERHGLTLGLGEKASITISGLVRNPSGEQFNIFVIPQSSIQNSNSELSHLIDVAPFRVASTTMTEYNFSIKLSSISGSSRTYIVEGMGGHVRLGTTNLTTTDSLLYVVCSTGSSTAQGTRTIGYTIRCCVANGNSGSNTTLVSFDTNGGNTIAPIEYVIGSTYGTLPEPTKGGCSFAGWYSDQSLSTRVYSTSTVSSSVTKLYAKWTTGTVVSPIEKNVVLNAMGLLLSSYSDTALQGDGEWKLTESYPSWITGCSLYVSGGGASAKLSHDKYVSFSGSFIIGIAAQENTSSKEKSCTLSLYNKKSGRVEYKINVRQRALQERQIVLYKNDGVGSGSKSYKAQEGDTWKLPSIASLSWTRDGYKFLGWGSSSTATTPTFNDQQSLSVFDDISLYAIWELISGATPSNDSFLSPEKIMGSSGSTSGSNVGATMESAETKPRAQAKATGSVWYKWEAPFTGTATFDTIGSGFDTVLGVYTGASVSSLSEENSDDDGAGGTASKLTFNAVYRKVYMIAVYGYNGKTGNISLKWSLATSATAVKVSFNSNGGGFEEDGGAVRVASVETGGALGDRVLPAPTKAGYMFLGWYTSKSGGVKVTAETVVTGDMTVYAQWAAAWTVKFNANGGTVATAKKLVKKGKAIGTLPKPARSGYTFKGWYTKKSGGSKVTTKTKVKKNVTYYAHWTVKKYTVKLKKTGKGTVSGGGKKNYKAKITLKAKPSKGYVFKGWYDVNGNLVSSKATWKTKVPLGGATYTARFEKKAAVKTVKATGTRDTPPCQRTYTGMLADGTGSFTLLVDGDDAFLAVKADGGNVAAGCEIISVSDGEIVAVTVDGAVFRLVPDVKR
jgi:uncharacterized repeat protein (TIGR02543 family)